MADTADHGGGIDAAIAQFGGTRAGWIDLSTGINPTPYPLGSLPADAWNALPDTAAFARLETAARQFWAVPDGAAILPAPGASALIARMPSITAPGAVHIPGPTYNEHARAFAAQGWAITDNAKTRVIVHPNNPDGRQWQTSEFAQTTIIDESFCDVTPDASLIAHATRPDTIILKSFGKFWGLAGLRLGFAIGDPALIAKLAQSIGPWAVSGPAIEIGTRALNDQNWATQTRTRLATDAARLDALLNLPVVGGTTLFRLYDTPDAAALQTRLARHHIWTRIFPYSTRWIRFGLPGTPDHWSRLQSALTA